MVLNCFYYLYVQSDPSFAGRFSIHNDATADVFIAPILVTLCLLAVYYLQYVLSLFLGFARLCSKETGKARKISFAIGQIIHLLFVIPMLFGTFSRHFANGGIQLVAYAVINLYVYLLCFLNYPVTVYIKEYDLGEDEQNLTGEMIQEDLTSKKGSKSPLKQKTESPYKMAVDHNEIEMQAQRRGSLMGGTGMNCDEEDDDDNQLAIDGVGKDSELVSRNYGDTQGSIQF